MNPWDATELCRIESDLKRLRERLDKADHETIDRAIGLMSSQWARLAMARHAVR